MTGFSGHTSLQTIQFPQKYCAAQLISALMITVGSPGRGWRGWRAIRAWCPVWLRADRPAPPASGSSAASPRSWSAAAPGTSARAPSLPARCVAPERRWAPAALSAAAPDTARPAVAPAAAAALRPPAAALWPRRSAGWGSCRGAGLRAFGASADRPRVSCCCRWCPSDTRRDRSCSSARSEPAWDPEPQTPTPPACHAASTPAERANQRLQCVPSL